MPLRETMLPGAYLLPAARRASSGARCSSSPTSRCWSSARRRRCWSRRPRSRAARRSRARASSWCRRRERAAARQPAGARRCAARRARRRPPTRAACCACRLAGAPPRLRVVAVSESTRRLGGRGAARARGRAGRRPALPLHRPADLPPGPDASFWKAFARQATAPRLRDARAGPGACRSAARARTARASRCRPRGSRRAARRTARSTLPRDLALGDWTLERDRRAAPPARATFAVQEYRKPEFQVEVTPDREVYVNGDEVRFKVAATYFFGAPVFGARGALQPVRVAPARRRAAGTRRAASAELGLRPRAQDRRGAHRPRRPRGAAVRAGARGLRPPADARGRGAWTPSSRQVAARGSAVMGRGMFAVTVRPLNRVVTVGEPVRARGARPRPRRPAGARGGDGDARPGRVEPARAPLHALDAPAGRGHR